MVTWMDLQSIRLSEISQREKGKYCKSPPINGIQKTKQTSQKQTHDTENKLLFARGEEGKSWTNQVKGVKRYTLLVIQLKSQ